MLDLIIKGGQVVTPQGAAVMDVTVQGDKTVAVGWPGTLAADAARVIAATGKIVVPGGIEPHAHISIPVPEHNQPGELTSLQRDGAVWWGARDRGEPALASLAAISRGYKTRKRAYPPPKPPPTTGWRQPSRCSDAGGPTLVARILTQALRLP
jgi:hypothetical protein